MPQPKNKGAVKKLDVFYSPFYEEREKLLTFSPIGDTVMSAKNCPKEVKFDRKGVDSVWKVGYNLRMETHTRLLFSAHQHIKRWIFSNKTGFEA